MSWLKKRFVRLRRFAGLKPSKSSTKSTKSASIDATSSTSSSLPPSLLSEPFRNADDDESSLSTSQLTLELKSSKPSSAASNSSHSTIGSEAVVVQRKQSHSSSDSNLSNQSVDSIELSAATKQNLANRLPTKVPVVNVDKLPAQSRKNQNNNLPSFDGDADDRWAVEPKRVAAAPAKRAPRSDRVRPAAAVQIKRPDVLRCPSSSELTFCVR